MKPMHIDFATAAGAWRLDWRMPATRLACALIVLALLAGALAGQRGLALRRATEQAIEAQSARTTASQRAAQLLKQAARLGAEDEALLRQSALLRAMRWEEVFRAFESAPPARLESFEPDLARGVIKVQAHAADIGAVQDYLARLQRSPVLVRVSLLRHELPAEGGGIDFHYEAVLAGPYRLPETAQRGQK